nr:MAG TPA: hypothetical protein [Caudoviricetes sp.]
MLSFLKEVYAFRQVWFVLGFSLAYLYLFSFCLGA